MTTEMGSNNPNTSDKESTPSTSLGDVTIEPGSPAFNQDTILLKWVQSQLKDTKCPKQVTNLGADLNDSVAMLYLLNKLCPNKCDLEGLN